MVGGVENGGLKTMKRPARKSKGQTLVEYAMILVLVSIICIAVLESIFGKSAAPYEKVVTEGFDSTTTTTP